MPARHGIAAAALVACGLVLRRQISVRVAEAIARVQIPTVAAWRRMDGDTVLHGLRQDGCSSASRRHAQLGGQCCGGNADDHGSSPIKPEACRRFHDVLTGRPITIEALLLRPCNISKRALNIR